MLQGYEPTQGLILLLVRGENLPTKKRKQTFAENNYVDFNDFGLL